VCHCLGGLVVKKVSIAAAAEVEFLTIISTGISERWFSGKPISDYLKVMRWPVVLRRP
jgi:hypothetical protein